MRMPRGKTVVAKREKKIRPDRDKRKSSRNRGKKKNATFSASSQTFYRDKD